MSAKPKRWHTREAELAKIGAAAGGDIQPATEKRTALLLLRAPFWHRWGGKDGGNTPRPESPCPFCRLWRRPQSERLEDLMRVG